MSFVRVSDVSKQIGEISILDRVNLTQEKGERIAIAGETGSGKSSLLKVIGGLLQPDSGEVVFADKRVLGPEEKLMPGHPGICYLSQQFELPNHYRVEELVNFENKLSIRDAKRLYEICEISHLLARYTHQLSGGEKQRIGLARTLITVPRLLLLDEPFSNLDLIHKNTLKGVIRNIEAELGTSIVMVSHDPQDSLSWADTIYVMKNGRVLQKDRPDLIYKRPSDRYVAGLFGKYALLPPSQLAAIHPELPSGEGLLFYRPEDFQISEGGPLHGRVRHIHYLGYGYELEIAIQDQLIAVKSDRLTVKEGDAVSLSVRSDEYWRL